MKHLMLYQLNSTDAKEIKISNANAEQTEKLKTKNPLRHAP